MLRPYLLTLLPLLMASQSGWAHTEIPLQQFAQQAELRFGTLSNFNQEGMFTAQITINNRSGIALPAGLSDWKIYVHSVRRILSINTNQFDFKRVQGDLYELSPTVHFPGLSAGGSYQLQYQARAHIVSYSDYMPRAFIANNKGETATFANTDTEDLKSFIDPFLRPEQQQRFNLPSQDFYPVITAEKRYELNKQINSPSEINNRIIPHPKQITYEKGIAELDKQWTIRESGGLINEARLLAEELSYNNLQINIVSSQNASKKNAIELTIDPQIKGQESYRLQITPEKITISASTAAGIFYGTQSLLSLIPADTSASYKLAAQTITDEPRYAWRGMHYDLARNFHGKDAVISLIKQMSRYKLNKLHLHLTDDEGWRLEIPELPELTDIGAFRCFDLTETTCLLTQLGNGPTKKAAGNGYLSTKDFVEILKISAQHHIEVIPEIDMPGHSRAAVKAMEARYKKWMAKGDKQKASRYLLSDPEDKSAYLTVQSYSDNAINVCLDSTYHFAEKVIYELQQMYRQAGQKLTVFHMGGDEVGKGAWTQSPACEKLFSDEKPGVTGIADLKPYFVKRLGEITHARGLMLAGWEDGLMYDPQNPFDRDQLPNTQVIANTWDNIWEAGVADRSYRLANAGYKVIISSATHLYFDHPHEANPNERGYHWATRFTDLYKIFNFTPDKLYANADNTFEGVAITNLNALVGRIQPELTQPENILGIQGQVWSETIRTPEQLQRMIFPRLLVLAERAWFKAPWENAPDDRPLRDQDWAQFSTSLARKELPKLSQRGVHFYVAPPGAHKHNENTLANTALPNTFIEYSLDKGASWFPYNPDNNRLSSNSMLRARIANETSDPVYME